VRLGVVAGGYDYVWVIRGGGVIAVISCGGNLESIGGGGGGSVGGLGCETF